MVATRVVAGATAVEEDMVADLADVLGRRATLVAGTATCLAIALKAKNATTVSCSLFVNGHIKSNWACRWRGRSFESRLPFGANLGTRLLQMQATRSHSGRLRQLNLSNYHQPSSHLEQHNGGRYVIFYSTSFFFPYGTTILPVHKREKKKKKP